MGQGNYELWVVLIALAAFLSSAVAVFVGLTTKNAFLKAEKDLLKFQVDLFEKLDARYWRKEDHEAYKTSVSAAIKNHDDSTNREEEHYRSYAGKELSGLQVQVFQNKEDVTLLLKGVLAAIKSGGGSKD